MKFKIKPERFEEFKEYLASKLTKESGKLYLPEEIAISKEEIKVKVKDKYKIVVGDVSLSQYNGDTVKNIEYIMGSIYLFMDHNIKSLGSIESLQTFDATDASVLKDLGNLKETKNHFRLFCCRAMTSLGKLKKVGKHCNLQYTDIKSLGALEYIGGDLILSKDVKLEDIGNLKYVGGKLKISDEQAKIFGDKVYKDGDDYCFKNEKYIEEDSEILL